MKRSQQKKVKAQETIKTEGNKLHPGKKKDEDTFNI